MNADSAAALDRTAIEPVEVRALRGDAEAEREVCRRLLPAVRAFAQRRLRAASVEDFAHDALLLLVEAIRAGRIEDPARIAGFALGICRNLARERARTSERRRELGALYGLSEADFITWDQELAVRREHLYSKNITSDETTGIGRWSVDDFERALTRGVTPSGYMVRKPMPLFARLDRTDVAAIYAFLRSVPKVRQSNIPGGHALKKAAPGDSPEVLFVNVGCAACHGKTGPYRSKLAGALAKSDAEVASWILDPQSRKPGAAMPAFQSALDRTQAEALARYVKRIAQEGG